MEALFVTVLVGLVICCLWALFGSLWMLERWIWEAEN